MNEQEKALWQEFLTWLPKNVKKFSNMTPENIEIEVSRMSNSEQGKAEITEYINAFKQSKQSGIKFAKQGSKIDYLVNKFAEGGENKDVTHKKTNWVPWVFSFMAADAKDLPKRSYNHDPREYKRVINPVTGEIRDRVINKRNGIYTERRIKDGDTVFVYNGFHYPGDEMYDRYTNAFKQYGVYEDGGKLNLDFFKK